MYRKGTYDDCRQIYNLICDMESTELDYDKFSEIYKNQLNSESYYSLVRCAGDEVIGVINLRFERQLHHVSSVAEIMEFSVSPDFRNKGIGKEMFAKACELSKDAGCIQIEVACNQLRKDTHRFYLREGMHNFHYKFSLNLTGNDSAENAIGK